MSRKQRKEIALPVAGRSSKWRRGCGWRCSSADRTRHAVAPRSDDLENCSWKNAQVELEQQLVRDALLAPSRAQSTRHRGFETEPAEDGQKPSPAGRRRRRTRSRSCGACRQRSSRAQNRRCRASSPLISHVLSCLQGPWRDPAPMDRVEKTAGQMVFHPHSGALDLAL